MLTSEGKAGGRCRVSTCIEVIRMVCAHVVYRCKRDVAEGGGSSQRKEEGKNGDDEGTGRVHIANAV